MTIVLPTWLVWTIAGGVLVAGIGLGVAVRIGAAIIQAELYNSRED